MAITAALWSIVGAMPLRADPDDLPGGPATAEPVGPDGMALGSLQPVGGDSVVFAALGDYGTRSEGQGQVARMVKAWLPDFILTTGDNIYGDLDTETDADPFTPGVQCDWESHVGAYFGEFIRGRSDGKFPRQTSAVQRFFPAVGNHDSWPDGGTGGPIDGYLDYFFTDTGGGGRLPTDRGAVHNAEVSWYALRRGPVDLFILDADAAHVPEAIASQRAWLAAQAAASDARWKVAVFHQPPVTSNAWRPGATWMAWPELQAVDAILCGHDHFYERLAFMGKPLVICGGGGAGLYDFAASPHPDSLFRHRGFSAARVMAHSRGLVVECRGVGNGSEDVLHDVLTLGSADPADTEDCYTFFAEAGQQVVVRTSTPAGAGELDPVLLISPPAGGVAGTDDNGAGDGRNARIALTIGETGRWKVRVTAATAAGGNYGLEVRLTNPAPAFPEWAASLTDPASDGDPDRDGLVNLLEHALGSDAAAAGPAPLSVEPGDGMVSVQFDVPSPPRRGIDLTLEASSDLAGGAWTPVAVRPAAGDWSGVGAGTLVTAGTVVPGKRRVSVLVPRDAERRWFRLKATQQP